MYNSLEHHAQIARTQTTKIERCKAIELESECVHNQDICALLLGIQDVSERRWDAIWLWLSPLH